MLLAKKKEKNNEREREKWFMQERSNKSMILIQMFIQFHKKYLKKKLDLKLKYKYKKTLKNLNKYFFLSKMNINSHYILLI